uniref:ABC transporter ATP-binding subunit n=1 Tax=Ancoracysta twista TaxID=2044563 RepID=A0A2H4R8H9_9EUKA|nr:ABC transporter ATP-binding subunit [Ancoracysta twista]ATY40960.1 ABC transporter ATP-binding subunit [Ancoracysta twista]
MFKQTSISTFSLDINKGEKKLQTNINLTLKPGSVCFLDGANGSGKTTMLRTLLNLQPKFRGILKNNYFKTFEGHYVSNSHPFDDYLTLHENLLSWCGAPSNQYTQEEMEKFLILFDLHHKIEVPFGLLSDGQKKKANLSRLLLHPLKLWILDEPAVFLDQKSFQLLINLMKEHQKRGGISLVITHIPFTISNSYFLKF